MRLNKYINERIHYKNIGRGKGISMEEAVKMAPNYSDAIENSVPIIRHSPTADQHLYYLVDPKKSKVKRGSRNTKNYYTLIMDNSSAWKKYPKRSESLIATINSKCGPKYPMRLLPKNGSKIGVCLSADLWFSFTDSFPFTMDRVNEVIGQLLFISNDVLFKFDKDIISITTAFANFDNWYKEQKDIDDVFMREFNDNYSLGNMKEFMKDYKGDLYKMMESKLNPNKNGFKLITTSNIGSISGRREVWTDSESLMVRCDEWWKFYKEI